MNTRDDGAWLIFWAGCGPLILLLIGMIIVIGLEMYEDVDPPKQSNVVYKDYGQVTKISNCHAGKYSYNCFVYTNKVYFKEKVDITRYPGEMLEVGDSIGYQEVYFNNGRVDYSKCRNNRCTLIGSKSWYMPKDD